MKRLQLLLITLALLLPAAIHSHAQSVVENYEWSPGTTAPTFDKMNLPFYSAYIEPFSCKLIKPVNGGSSYLVYASYGIKTNDNEVNFVFLIPGQFSNKHTELYPPKITALRYHNLGGGGEAPDFCSVVIDSYRRKTNNNWTTMNSERKITEECANMLIDLISGDGKFKFDPDYPAPVEFEETFNAQILDPF